MRVLFALCMMCAVASAAPPYSFDELLARSETVFVGDLAGGTATLEFKPTKVLRGTPPSPAKLDFSPRFSNGLPKGITRYVVISQGDDRFDKPTPRAVLNQEPIGQAGFRGWILFPVQDNGDVTGAFRYVNDKRAGVTLAEVPAIVAHAPYKPKG